MKQWFLIAITAASILSARTCCADDEDNYHLDVPAMVEFRAKQHILLDQINKISREVRAALYKGEIAKATDLCEQAIKIAPMFAESEAITVADIYARAGKTRDVIRVLKPVIYPLSGVASNTGSDLRIRMQYVLAVLDTSEWPEAAAVYERSFEGVSTDVGAHVRNGEAAWRLPGYFSAEHTLPEAHFKTDLPDYAGLRAQAHLILGMQHRLTGDGGNEADLPYMLGHLQQALRNNRRSLDAMFGSAYLLGKMGRYAEARETFKKTAKMAPKEAGPEIDAALKDLQERENRQKAADQTAREKTPKTSPQN